MNFNKKLSNNPNRKELFNYIFDMLEYLDLVKWTKIYNRKFILEAFVQIDVEPYIFAEKSSNAFGRGISRCFYNYKEFNLYSNKKNNRYIYNYLLNLLDYKYCNICKNTIKIHNFTHQAHTGDKIEGSCKKCNKIKRENSKVEDNKVRRERYYKNKQYLYNVLLPKYNIKPCCSICEYDSNVSSLDFHHNKPEEKVYKVSEMLNRSRNTFITLFKVEVYNLSILCANCHKEEHTESFRIKGLVDSLNELGYSYKCAVTEHTNNLHLHHNNMKEKEYAFHDFIDQSKDKILKEGLLETEMNKDIMIVSPNTHMEIHNPTYNKEVFFND